MPIREINSPSIPNTDNRPASGSSAPAAKQSKEEIFIPETPKYTFDDLILPTSVRNSLLDVADYVKNSHIVFDVWGFGKTHKNHRGLGINLYGPPGTGKTMAAHALADYMKRKILAVNYADIESKYVGETPKNIRRAFEVAKETNSIIFFDEADAILSKRVTNMSSASDVSVNQTRSVMLVLMNDYQDFILFATNFIQNFDAAFMRRIAKHVKFELPDLECRRKLWDQYIPREMPTNADVHELAEKYENISGSDISTAVLNAAFKAARQEKRMVEKEYIFEAIEDITKSKEANQGYTVTTKNVSKEYVKQQLGYLPDVKENKESEEAELSQ